MDALPASTVIAPQFSEIIAAMAARIKRPL
jgi:hypothetical protein